MIKAKDLIARYESYCPQELSLEGDISGLQIGSLDKLVNRVMVTLDVRETTVSEAIEKGVDLIITKHAPIFRPLKELTLTPQNKIYIDLIKYDIAVYVSHTNIDIVPDGLNDWFCDRLGIKFTKPLRLTKDSYGIGRIGDVPRQTFSEFAVKIKNVFHLDSVRLVSYGQESKIIRRVAICGGSGDDFYKDALVKGADVYVTGDIYYHTAQEMITNGLLAIDPGHHIEVLFIEKIVEKLNEWKKEMFWSVDIIASQAQTNPFSHL